MGIVLLIGVITIWIIVALLVVTIHIANNMRVAHVIACCVVVGHTSVLINLLNMRFNIWRALRPCVCIAFNMVVTEVVEVV